MSPKRQKVTTSGTTATELEAEIAAKQAQLAALLRDQSQAGSSTTPGNQKQISTHLPVTNAYLLVGFKSLDIRTKRTTHAMVARKRGQVASDRAKEKAFRGERTTLLARLGEVDALVIKNKLVHIYQKLMITS